MMLEIFFWVDCFLLFVAALAHDALPWAPRAAFVLVVIALVILGLHAFGFH